MQNIKNRKWGHLKRKIIFIIISLIVISIFFLYKSKGNTANKDLIKDYPYNSWEILKNTWKILTKSGVNKRNFTKIIPKANYDFDTDLLITKYVSNTIHFNDLKYEPNDLTILKWEHLINQKANSKLRKIALENLENMAKDFYDNFKVRLFIVSAYRSYDYQKWIENNNPVCIKERFCAKAWYSEHQTWLAIDIFETSDYKSFLSNKKYKKYYDWLQENAYKYWFHNTYQKWIEIDWYNEEPWHWRYLWTNLAKKLEENNQTFWLYFSKNK